MEEIKNKLFVSNLSYEMDDDALLEAFSNIDGVEIVEAKVIIDKYNGGRSKGFGFVTVKEDSMAEVAIAEMNGKELGGRQIFVNLARPQEKRTNSGDRGGYNSGNRNRY